MRLKYLTLALTVLCTLFGAMAAAQDVTKLMLQADKEENAMHENEALKIYLQVIRLQPANEEALCRASELCSRIGFRQSTEKVMIDYYRAARKFAELALKVNPKSSEGNVAMAMAIGRMALVVGGKEKIAAVKEIKSYAETALVLDNTNFKAYHILGKWHLEMVSLSSIQRSAIKVFFGEMPKASIGEAILNFEKTRQLRPGFILNYLELGKAYEKNNENKKAKEVLTAMLPLPNLTEEDSISKKEAEVLLKKLK